MGNILRVRKLTAKLFSSFGPKTVFSEDVQSYVRTIYVLRLWGVVKMNE